MTPFLTKYEQDDHQLLKKVAEGNERAFTLLFNKYAPGLAQYIYRLAESREVTEEIIQDVFTIIWEKRLELSTLDNLSNYIFIISRNKTLDHLRKQAANRCKHREWSRHLSEEFDQVENGIAEKEEWCQLIDKVVEKLPPQQRLVYTLSRVERLKYEEIAQRLGLTKETVKKHMKLALLFLRTNVEFMMKRVICSPIFLCLFLF